MHHLDHWGELSSSALAAVLGFLMAIALVLLFVRAAIRRARNRYRFGFPQRPKMNIRQRRPFDE